MPNIKILSTGRIDERDSAFPQAVQLPNGNVLCSFSVGGGQSVTGGTDWARSTDGGETWTVEGTILPATSNPETTNSLKLTISPNGGTIYAYGARSLKDPTGEARRDPVFCHSTDGGHTWSAPQVVPKPNSVGLGISHGILTLSSGRLLAPAVIHEEGRLGDRTVTAISDDGGKTWPIHTVVFKDANKERGYLELKLAELGPRRLVATCWTTDLSGGPDHEDSFSISNDDGSTWTVPTSTGIMGQTMTPVPLGQDRLLVLYNRRYRVPALMMALATFTDDTWTVHHERVMYDPLTSGSSDQIATGKDEWTQFEFGFPTAIPLQDGTHLATHWSKEGGKFGVRWTKLQVIW